MDIQNMEAESCIRLESQVDDDNLGEYNEEDLNDDGKQDINAPYIGMEFPTDDDAYNFYNTYALRMGFGIRRHSTNKSRISDIVIAKIFVCNKQGQIISQREGTARSTRTGCEAKMKIIRTESGSWKVSQFEHNHVSHELTSPGKVLKHRSHRQLHRTKSVRNLIDGLHDQGLRPCAIAKVVNQVSGSEKGTVTPQQCVDHLRVARKNNIGRECVRVVNHFQDKMQLDRDFFFRMEVNQERILRSVFWADGRSRASYLQFSDVIIFDVTYRTNKFNLPFAPFTGVNHHKQSTLFGCALLADETEETFVWLFEEWLKCMGGKAPGAIITDQDPAICNAIARVFPQTHHRYCKWHLDKHIAEHMVHLKSQLGADIENDFQKLQQCDSIKESERCWDEFMKKYTFDKNSWLARIWDKRHHWIPCYFKDVFLAGMKTSQRSESINHFFDGFVHSHTPLDEFVKQYDNAVASRRAAEEDEDFRTKNSEPILTLKTKIEMQAGRCYTRNLFEIFQRELKEGAYFFCEKMSKEENVFKYIIGPDDVERSYWKTVTYDDSNGIMISCECSKFEMEGILCRHALKLLNKKRVSEISDCYILKRWTIEARYQKILFNSLPTVSSHCVTNEAQVNDMVKWSIRTKFNDVIEEANSITTLKRLDSYLSDLLIEIKNQNKAIVNTASVNQVSSSTPIPQFESDIPEITVRDPSGPIKTKGRPKTATRIRSGLEQSQEVSQKKQRTCGFCGGKGHYKTGCYKVKGVPAPSGSSPPGGSSTPS